MKNKKNIKLFNSLVMHYIVLHGLEGSLLGDENLFIRYFTSMYISNVIIKINGNGNNIIQIPNSIFHSMIYESYKYYQNINELLYNTVIREQLRVSNHDEIISTTIDVYKKTLYQILNNYNSKELEYNKIKISVFKDELKKVVSIEDYETASKINDKITFLENQIQKKDEF